METHSKGRLSVVLPLAVVALSILMLAPAGAAFASGGDMSEMSGMTDKEMQNMATPAQPAAAVDAHATAPAADGHAAEAEEGAHGAMTGSSVNWLVIGGFVVLIVGSTLTAAATRRHLRRRMLTGELAGAGVQDV